MQCPECYSDNPRITPLIKPEHCLKNHRQYVCSKCGRCICAQVDQRGKFRAKFPFRTLEIAKLYLRSAEVIHEKPCGIYGLKSKNGRKFYKIFRDRMNLIDYLRRNLDKTCDKMRPLFNTEINLPAEKGQVRRLTADEVSKYLQERSKTEI